MPCVKCADCGFVMMRKLDTREACEVEEVIRTTGKIPSANNFNFYESKPRCSVGAMQIEPHSGNLKPDEILELMQCERECDKFREWTPGFSPKEHIEMTILDEQRKWQRDCQREDREWRERQAERDRQWRIEDQKAAAESFKGERLKTWAVAAWTLAASLITWVISLAAQ